MQRINDEPVLRRRMKKRNPRNTQACLTLRCRKASPCPAGRPTAAMWLCLQPSARVARMPALLHFVMLALIEKLGSPS